MHRNRSRMGALLLLTAVGALLGAGCDEVPPLFVRSCLAESADSCTVTTDSLTTFLSQGSFDSSFGNDYSCPLLVGNTGNPAIQITGADVQVLAADGTAIGAATPAAPTSGFIESGTISVPGLGVSRVQLLDVKTAESVLATSSAGATVVATVVLHGTTLDGREVTSPEWHFPIKVLPHQGLCDLTPCLPGSNSSGFVPHNCHPGINTSTDCRQGCGCTPDKGECAPLSCVLPSPGAPRGTCEP